MTLTSVDTIKHMRETAAASGVAPNFARYMDNPYLGLSSVIMNAANEIAVAAFLQDRCRIVDIDRIVEQTMNAFDVEDVESIEQLEEVDMRARRFARELVAKGVLQ